MILSLSKISCSWKVLIKWSIVKCPNDNWQQFCPWNWLTLFSVSSTRASNSDGVRDCPPTNSGRTRHAASNDSIFWLSLSKTDVSGLIRITYINYILSYKLHDVRLLCALDTSLWFLCDIVTLYILRSLWVFQKNVIKFFSSITLHEVNSLLLSELSQLVLY